MKSVAKGLKGLVETPKRELQKKERPNFVLVSVSLPPNLGHRSRLTPVQQDRRVIEEPETVHASPHEDEVVDRGQNTHTTPDNGVLAANVHTNLHKGAGDRAQITQWTPDSGVPAATTDTSPYEEAVDRVQNAHSSPENGVPTTTEHIRPHEEAANRAQSAHSSPDTGALAATVRTSTQLVEAVDSAQNAHSSPHNGVPTTNTDTNAVGRSPEDIPEHPLGSAPSPTLDNAFQVTADDSPPAIATGRASEPPTATTINNTYNIYIIDITTGDVITRDGTQNQNDGDDSGSNAADTSTELRGLHEASPEVHADRGPAEEGSVEEDLVEDEVICTAGENINEGSTIGGGDEENGTKDFGQEEGGAVKEMFQGGAIGNSLADGDVLINKATGVDRIKEKMEKEHVPPEDEEGESSEWKTESSSDEVLKASEHEVSSADEAASDVAQDSGDASEYASDIDTNPDQESNSEESLEATLTRLSAETVQLRQNRDFLLQILKNSNRHKEQYYDELNTMTNHAATQERRLFEALHSVAFPQPRSFETRKLLLLQEGTIRDLRLQVEEGSRVAERVESENRRLEVRSRADKKEIEDLAKVKRLLEGDLQCMKRQTPNFERQIQPERDMLALRLDHEREIVKEIEELKAELEVERSKNDVLAEQARLYKDQVTLREMDLTCAQSQSQESQTRLERALQDMTAQRDEVERKMTTLIGLSFNDRSMAASQMRDSELAAAQNKIQQQRREIAELKQLMCDRRTMGYDPAKAVAEEEGRHDATLEEDGIEACPCHPRRDERDDDSGFEDEDAANEETFGEEACRELEAHLFRSSVNGPGPWLGSRRIHVRNFSRSIH